MKPIRTSKIISLFIACCLLIATFAAPASLAVTTSKSGILMLEKNDWKVVKVGSKKAFNLTVQDFSDAYDAIARSFVQKEDESHLMLLNLGNSSDYRFKKMSVEGGEINLYSTHKSDAKKGKITRIDIDFSNDSNADYDYGQSVLACLAVMFSNYDQDSSKALIKKIESALNSDKKTTSFSRGNLKYTVKKSDDPFTLLYLTVTPK